MKRFFAQDAAPGALVELRPEELHHMRKVMRVEDGEHIVLFDGKGAQYEAVVEITADGKTLCRVLDATGTPSELPVEVTVCQAVLKGDRFDYAVQKAVEAGATRIVPFISERCVRAPGNMNKFVARAQRVAQEAARQCGRSFVPQVDPCHAFSEVLHETAGSLTIVAYEEEKAQSFRQTLEGSCPKALNIVVGPEGGFAPEEIDELIENGAMCVTLGPRILRAETAAVYMLAQIAYACER